MTRAQVPSDLDLAPRLGWVDAPTPVVAVPALAERLGLEYLGAKRDDRLSALFGGTKPRKLDYVLAEARFSDAPRWASTGAIGSGSLVALTAAAAALGRQLDAHVFWTGLSAGVLDNLAFTASGPTRLRYYGSRVTLALRSPRVLVGETTGGVPVVAPGATSPTGMLGLVRAGLELAEQIRAGELPEPERLYVAFGSGGTAVGLAVGLALAGLSTTVFGVGVVERVLSPIRRVRMLRDALLAKLAALGIDAPAGPVRLAIDRRYAGRGYAQVTRDGLSACAALEAEGLSLEPIYTGKAMAALLAAARAGNVRRVLFWQTRHTGELPHDDDWRGRLPTALAHRLASAEAGERTPRRRVLLALGAVALAAGVGVRVTGYPALPGWHGAVLARWEAHVFCAAAEALLPPAPVADAGGEIAARVDRYLVGMPSSVQRDIHGMLALVEHGTFLGGRGARFTRLAPAERRLFLERFAARGGLLAQAYGGMRDLVYLAYYQQSSTWGAIGYDGPRVPLDYDPRGPDRLVSAVYDDLRAPAGSLPRGVVL